MWCIRCLTVPFSEFVRGRALVHGQGKRAVFVAVAAPKVVCHPRWDEDEV